MLTDESGHLTDDDHSETWNQGQLTPSGRVSDSMRMFANKRGKILYDVQQHLF